jgi:signal transduction histidine kinase
VAAGERRYDLDDLALAEELSQRAALAVDSARLFQAEQVARSRAERVAARDKALYAVTSALSAALTPERTGAVVIEQGQAALGAVAGLLALLADDGTVLEIVAESGYAAAAVAPWHRIPLDAPIPLAAAARTGVPLYYESYAALIAAYPHLAHGVRTGHEAVAALPLRVEGRAIGVLGLSFAGVHPFAAEDLAFMGALADQSAQALERARLYAGEARARQAAEDLARQRQEFVATASHELKTPLTTLLGHVELLGRQLSRPVPDTARVNRYLGVLQSAAGRLGALVDDLLDTARIQQGYLALRLAPCDLVVIARDVLQRAEESIERTARHTLALDAPTSVPGVWDGERLDQVLSNLVSNALKYSPDGGEVRVRVVPTPEDVAIVVSDQGIGIAPDETTLLFEPFARGRILREMVGGTGLGLYIVRQNIEQHGGAIVIESTPGVGTTITVRLPRGTATAADAPASGGRPEPSNP